MASTEYQSKLRSLPSVEEVLQALSHDETNTALHALPHLMQADIVRSVIAAHRNAILAGTQETASLEAVLADAQAHMAQALHPSLQRTINATGVIVHTNLGRSALAEDALQAVVEVSKGYSTLEYNIEAMERGSRHVHYEQLICTLTGAEAAIAVNNNAAAVMMVLHEFARGKEAIISRGELIEIGGSFRIPDIMDFSQAHMVEVGTTNKTHLYDFEQAITPQTAMLLKVHSSNYRLIGFTESVKAKDLSKLAQRINAHRAQAACSENTQAVHGAHAADTTAPFEPVIVYEDLGSGLLIRPDGITSDDEPTVAEAFAQGCDLVSFSGDKLLGGPQAGIIIGRKALIDRLKKNPLARALRLDKMTIAALEATLKLYLDPRKALTQIPTLNMLCSSAHEVQQRAQHLKDQLEQSSAAHIARFQVTPEIARTGGGSLPMFDIPSYGVEVSFYTEETQEGATALACMEYLVKRNPVPIIGRINHNKLIFDARTLLNNSDIDEIVHAMSRYAETHSA